ncbi:unnamed protein product [Arabidopsis lyrata]|nr:unnamed protein product [Arabidopsis lyrata]
MLDIVKNVKFALTKELTQREENPELEGEKSDAKEGVNKDPNRTEPGEQRLKQLGEKLDVECNDNETRIVAVVGMGGIGKTFLAKKLLEKLKRKIGSHVFIESVRETSKAHGFDKLKLQKTLVDGLLPNEDIICDNENPLEVWKDHLLKKKVAVVLDDVHGKEQVNALLGNCDWIKKGSRIIITTRDKSLLKGVEMVSDIYEVPGFNDSDSLELFSSYAFDDKSCKFMELSRKFVDYTGGNPLALKALGEELLGKDKGHWEARLVTLTQRSNEKIRKELIISYDELNEHQKDVFLDIACFFRSQDENYIKTLLHCSFDADESGEAGKEVRELSDKFLIRISEDRVEMNDLIYTLGRELAISCVETIAGKYRLLPSNREEFIDALKNKEERDKIRGIFLDMSKMEEIPLDYKAFVGMSNLRYLKVYNSHCPRQCEADSKLNLPDGLEFPICNVRYFHWLKFPEEELPCDLNPKNLIDLKLHYSQIRQVWTSDKATPRLKWVDLSHSSKLSSLLGLSKAPNLLRLNLEGCTSLEELSGEILQNMKNLILLNLRGCTGLVSLPKISLCSLKILILSGCSKFQKFQVISENLETLYLNGTAIDRLPPSVGNLQRLILLDLKDCKNLETLSDCTNLGNMRSLQELKLSGCSKLKSFPKNIENLRNLLLEGTAITKMPQNINGMSLLRRLCLSRSDEIYTLQFNTNELYHLKWLELMYCKNLTSLLGLPPNLQFLYAHGCTSLKTVSSPLALLISTEQIHSTFIFTNCHELEQVSKNDIMSSIQNTRHPTSYDQYNRGFVVKSLISTCFPGSDVPQWFKHQAFGSVLKQELPRHWYEGRVNGLALCVAVSFNNYKDQNNGLQVKCTFEFTDHANVSLSKISFFVGGWTKIPEDELGKIDSDHIFIGYNNWFYIKCEEDRHKNGCVPTNVSLRFEVTDGASKVKECKVMKCGFSLIYESEGSEKVSRDATFDANSKIEESKLSETKSYKTAEYDADFYGEGAQGLETFDKLTLLNPLISEVH